MIYCIFVGYNFFKTKPMKKVFLAIVLVSVAFTSCKNKKKDKVEVKEEVKVEEKVDVVDKGNVNVTESIITWKGTKPVGSAHHGVVSLDTGSLTFEKGLLKAGEFVIDMNTITCEDLEGEKKADLEGHLKNADFFDVAKFPTSKFVITSSEVKDGKLAVTGNLTIKNVTKNVTVPVTVTESEDSITFKSDVFKVDRTEFGVKYNSGKFFDNLKDKMIDDLIEFTFELKTKK